MGSKASFEGLRIVNCHMSISEDEQTTPMLLTTQEGKEYDVLDYLDRVDALVRSLCPSCERNYAQVRDMQLLAKVEL